MRQRPMDEQFTQLARRASQDASARPDWWRAVLDLERWFFIHRPRLDETETSPAGGSPLICRFEARRLVPAFTSEARATAAAQAGDIVDPGAGVSILTIERDAAVSMLCAADDDQIDGIVFNPAAAEPVLCATFADLAAMYEFQFDRLLPGMIDALVKAVASANTPQAWARLNRRVAEMDEWYYLKHEAGVYVARHSGDLCVLLFTDDPHARAGAKARELDPGLARAAPPDACLRLIRDSDAAVVKAIFNLGTRPFVQSMDDLVRFVTMARVEW